MFLTYPKNIYKFNLSHMPCLFLFTFLWLVQKLDDQWQWRWRLLRLISANECSFFPLFDHREQIWRQQKCRPRGKFSPCSCWYKHELCFWSCGQAKVSGCTANVLWLRGWVFFLLINITSWEFQFDGTPNAIHDVLSVWRHYFSQALSQPSTF